MDLTLLAAFAVACFVISVVPGPDMLNIVANALAGGRRAGLVSAFGMSTGLAIHTVAAAFGLGALIQAAPMALDIIRIFGAVFLLYLAVSTWLASRKASALPDAVAVAPTMRLRKVFLMATLTNLANPKVIIFFLAFFPQFLSPGAGMLPVTAQFLLLGATFIGIGICVDATVGFLAGTLSEQILRRRSFKRWLERVSAAIFGGLAVRLVLDARS
ncbi:LysE family translocator [Tenggerimyces flavus]|uniref:LysE family translocator n=1 Tax=Tenggerimyces flavus TaxID=1708749 RepID=A0ABV7YRF4_9ACTN|nr:LysE family translocator [Tenggerimyces flavus]MBM7784399.1 threonine/homoserine/homoserine lactone efflux protein [Tenggerimyces flavus]